MNKKIFIILVFVLFAPLNGVFADTPPTNEVNPEYQTYEFYQNGAKTTCDSPNALWGKNNALVPVPQYAELTAKAVNAQIERTKNLENLTDEEKTKLQTELNMGTIGDFSGFKTLEVARLQYRSTMNSIFACGIISSRLSILSDLREQISASSSTRRSEIENQLNKEEERLE